MWCSKYLSPNNHKVCSGFRFSSALSFSNPCKGPLEQHSHALDRGTQLLAWRRRSLSPEEEAEEDQNGLDLLCLAETVLLLLHELLYQAQLC